MAVLAVEGGRRAAGVHGVARRSRKVRRRGRSAVPNSRTTALVSVRCLAARIFSLLRGFCVRSFRKSRLHIVSPQPHPKQQHTGVVHSSNLCTEITLNTSQDEIAVCNLGSVNLTHHIKDGEMDETKLEKTINTAIRERRGG